MSRWGYDTVFYRVFCLTLLGITFAFTVILTNVFVDIDGLLYKNTKVNPEQEVAHTELAKLDVKTKTVEDVEYDFKDFGNEDSYDAERTKRSVDPFHLKDATAKKEILGRLTALLEDLDKEEADKTKRSNEDDKNPNIVKREKLAKYKDSRQINDKEKSDKKVNDVESDLHKSKDNIDDNVLDFIEKDTKEKKDKQTFAMEEEVRHLAMHNIILQGIVGHMNLNEVYNKMHALINKLEERDITQDIVQAVDPTDDHNLLNELVNCKQLKQQIGKSIRTGDEIKQTTPQPAQKVMIKTVIDINSMANEKTNQQNTSPEENIKGIVKLIYNGQIFKFRRVDENTTSKKPNLRNTNEKFTRKDVASKTMKDENAKLQATTASPKPEPNSPKMYANKFLSDYIKKISETGDLYNHTMFSKRSKRHINIEFDNEDNTTYTSTHLPSSKKDDELYLEIETHFNSKGLKGEDRKKMIRELIEKIQQAIRSENDKEGMPKKRNHLHVKKRTQDPIVEEPEKPYPNSGKPIYFLVRRESDPISKAVTLHENVPLITDHRGNYWHQQYGKPKFLSQIKGINSIEMNELQAEYNQDTNGILERSQKPLDTRGAELVLKDIAGSGFSIGFNQYVDDPPDTDSMNLFSGIENVIKTYHQKYDEGIDAANAKNNEQAPEDVVYPRASVNIEYADQYPENEEYLSNQEYPADQQYAYDKPYPTNHQSLSNHDYPSSNSDYYTNQDTYQDYTYRKNGHTLGQDHGPSELKKHTIARRSLEKIKQNIRSNEYPEISNKFHKQHSKKNKAFASLAKIPKFELTDNILSRHLKPSERKKRTINVKKILTTHNHKSLSRYFRTNLMAFKNILQQKKRKIRQIDQTILANDRSYNEKQNSAEEVFVFDRAVVRKDIPNAKINDERDLLNHQRDSITPIGPLNLTEKRSDKISAQKQSLEYYEPMPQPLQVPHQENDNVRTTSYNILDNTMEQTDAAEFYIARSRHNPLMSRYPHILMGETPESKDEYILETINETVKNEIPDIIEETTNGPLTLVQNPEKKYEYIQNTTSDLHPSYKLTIKVMPKNYTGLSSGFKETHTSINKSYIKNGVIYTSFVNVSEISKIEKLKNNDTSHKNPVGIKHVNKNQTKLTSILQDSNNVKKQFAQLLKEKEKQIINKPTPLRTTSVNVENNTDLNESLLNNIDKSERISDEIIKKIDRNTAILEKFLDIIFNTREANKQKPNYNEPKPNNINDMRQTKVTNTSIWLKPIDIFQNVPYLFFNQTPNFKHNSSVPFYYAYRRPNTEEKDKDMPSTNVIYEGHIITQTTHIKTESNKLENKKTQTPPQNISKDQSNQTLNNIQTNKKATDIKQIDPAYQNIHGIDQSYAIAESKKTKDTYPNNQSIKQGKKYLNKQSIYKSTSQNYPDKQFLSKNHMKINQNYENMLPKKLDPNNLTMQIIRNSLPYDNKHVRKTGYEDISRKVWSEKNFANDITEWKKKLRSEEKQKPVGVFVHSGINSTNFFIDDLEIDNEFKEIPFDSKKNIS